MIHTNGLKLFHPKSKATFKDLVEMGLTNVTFSIASFDSRVNREFMGIDQRPEELIDFARSLGLTVRCSLLLTKQTVYNLKGIFEYINEAKKHGARFVVIREIWIPELERIHEIADSETYNWCRANQVRIAPLIESIAKHRDQAITELKPLPWGQRVFDVNGINTTFAYCFEGQSGQTLKSLVAKPDGELYRGWDNEADVLY